MGRPNTALVISESERSQLQSLARSRSLPHSLVRRARIVLLSADGMSNRAVARKCGVSAPVVSLWRRRYQRDGWRGCMASVVRGGPAPMMMIESRACCARCWTGKPAAATDWKDFCGQIQVWSFRTPHEMIASFLHCISL